MDYMSMYVKFSSTASGRDKLFRLIQYTSKLIGYVIKNKKNGAEIFKRLKQMEGLLSSGRKTFRLGKSLDMLYSAAQALSVEDVQVKALVVSTRLSYAANFFYDNMDWFIKAGLFVGDSKYYSNLASKYWLWGIVFLLLRDLYELKKLSKEKRLTLKKLYMENPQIIVDILKNTTDLVMCLELLGHLQVSDGIVGICGIISSASGILQTLYPHYKITP